MRRVDPQEIMNYVPGRYKKFVNAIRKLENQNQKKKEKEYKMKIDKENEEDEEDLNLKFNEVEDSSGTWIIEGKTDDDILDFLGTTANKHISLTNPNKTKKKRSFDESFEVDEEGRMIIEEEEEKDDNEGLDSEDSNEQIENPKKKMRIDKSKVKKKEVEGKHSGVRYKSSKTGGDVKSGKFEPYAYIPLDPKQLNKRRRNTAYKKYTPYVKKHKKERN